MGGLDKMEKTSWDQISHKIVHKILCNNFPPFCGIGCLFYKKYRHHMYWCRLWEKYVIFGVTGFIEYVNEIAEHKVDES